MKIQGKSETRLSFTNRFYSGLFKNSTSDLSWLFYSLKLFFLLLSPSLFFLSVGIDFRSSPLSIKLGYLLLSIIALLFPLIFLRFRIYFLISFLLILLAPLELIHLYLFKAPISPAILSSIFNTNSSEAVEFISTYFLFIITFIICSLFYLWVVLKRIPKEIGFSKRMKIITVSFTVFILCILFSRQVVHTRSIFPNNSWGYCFNEATESFTLKFHKIFPYDIIIKFNAIKRYQHSGEIYKNNTQGFSFNAYSKNNLKDREIYVVVIGETSRYDHWSINGYTRETSPLLEKQNNLISFSNTISCANVTMHSIPFILTQLTPDTYKNLYKEMSFQKAFREAGYYTAWISNQNNIQNEDMPQILDADTTVVLNNEIDYDFQYDENVLPALDKILKSNHQKLLIVLHTMGSHFRYNFRYPKEYNYFKPSLEGTFDYGLMNSNNKQTIINTYDNSILYTDYILHSVIKKLEATQSMSSMFYISDHGENLCDDGRNLFFHCTPYMTKEEMHIPFFVWYSDSYFNQNNETISALKSNKDKAFSTSNFFYTLLDFAHIGYKNEELSKSVANSDFQPSKERKILNTDLKSVLYKENN